MIVIDRFICTGVILPARSIFQAELTPLITAEPAGVTIPASMFFLTGIFFRNINITCKSFDFDKRHRVNPLPWIYKMPIYLQLIFTGVPDRSPEQIQIVTAFCRMMKFFIPGPSKNFIIQVLNRIRKKIWRGGPNYIILKNYWHVNISPNLPLSLLQLI